MSEPDWKAQKAAWDAVVEALRGVDQGTRARVLSSVLVMFDLSHEVTARIAKAEALIGGRRG